MSIRVAAFELACPQPHTICSFRVWIPGIVTSPFIVTGATIPFETVNEIQVWTRGQAIYLPTKKQVPGEWTCTIEETMFVSTIRMLEGLQKKTQKYSNGVSIASLFNVIVSIMDDQTNSLPQHTTVLRGAWIKSISPLNVKSESVDPIKWNVSFRYSSILQL